MTSPTTTQTSPLAEPLHKDFVSSSFCAFLAIIVSFHPAVDRAMAVARPIPRV